MKTADRLFDIINFLQEYDCATVNELAEHLGLAKSTVYHHLGSLQSKGYVVKRDGKYRLGLRFLDHGIHVRNNERSVSAAQPVLEQVAKQTGEIAWLVTEQNGHAVYLGKAIGERGVQTTGRIGRHDYLHYLAAGKAMMADMSDSEIRKIVDHKGLPKRTDATITDAEMLRSELDEIAESGVAFSVEEEIANVAGAAVSVNDDDFRGAISVRGPASRLQEDLKPRLAGLLQHAAESLVLRLEHPQHETQDDCIS